MRNENVAESESQSQNAGFTEIKQSQEMDRGVQSVGKTPSGAASAEDESQRESNDAPQNARQTIIAIVKRLLDIFCL